MILTRRRALLLVNPHSRTGRQNASQASQILEALGLELIKDYADDVKELSQLIRKYQHQVDIVIIGGGDGTLNLAIEGLMDTGLTLGILPLGTANDLARTLAIPLTLQEACQIIATGEERRIDLGWANGKYFFNVASLGLSVQITQQLNKQAKHRWGILAYATTAAKVIWRSRPFRAEIRCNKQSIVVKTIQIAVGNGRYYGGGMAIAHNATIDDRRLDLYSLEVRHWWQILAVLPFLWQGRHNQWLGVRTLEGEEIEIYTRRSLPINTDGEITTATPVLFRVIPQALKVIVPRQ